MGVLSEDDKSSVHYILGTVQRRTIHSHTYTQASLTELHLPLFSIPSPKAGEADFFVFY